MAYILKKYIQIDSLDNTLTSLMQFKKHCFKIKFNCGIRYFIFDRIMYSTVINAAEIILNDPILDLQTHSEKWFVDIILYGEY